MALHPGTGTSSTFSRATLRINLESDPASRLFPVKINTPESWNYGVYENIILAAFGPALTPRNESEAKMRAKIARLLSRAASTHGRKLRRKSHGMFLWGASGVALRMLCWRTT